MYDHNIYQDIYRHKLGKSSVISLFLQFFRFWLYPGRIALSNAKIDNQSYQRWLEEYGKNDYICCLLIFIAFY